MCVYIYLLVANDISLCIGGEKKKYKPKFIAVTSTLATLQLSNHRATQNLLEKFHKVSEVS